MNIKKNFIRIIICIGIIALLIMGFFPFGQGELFGLDEDKTYAVLYKDWKNELSQSYQVLNKIRTITITTNSNKVPETAQYIEVGANLEGDSLKQEGDSFSSLKLFLKMNQETELFDLVFYANVDKIFAPSNCNRLFFGTSVSAFYFDNFDTCRTIDMSEMFSYSYKLQSIDISMFDTSNVTDMSNMFRNCRQLGRLDLSSFNTKKVVNMSYMFYSLWDSGIQTIISNLEEIIFPTTFDTSSVNNFDYMFAYCYKIKQLDLSSFEIPASCSTVGMFYYTRFNCVNTPKSFLSSTPIQLCAYNDNGAQQNINYYNEAGSDVKVHELDSSNCNEILFAKINLTLCLNNEEQNTIIFNLNCGEYYSFSNLPINLAKVGYNFNGWYFDSGCETINKVETDFQLLGGLDTSSGLFSITLYAGWNPKQYTIAFDYNGGILDGNNYSVNVLYNTAFDDTISAPIPDICPIGKIFKGYYINSDGTGTKFFNDDGTPTDAKWTIDSDSTLYAYYDYADYPYTFDASEGQFDDGDSEITKNITYLSTMPTLSAQYLPSRENYTFAGYFTQLNGGGDQYYDSNLTPTKEKSDNCSNMVLYAKWEPKVYKITLELDSETDYAEFDGLDIYERYGEGFYSSNDCLDAEKITSISVLPTILDGYQSKYVFEGFIDNNNQTCLDSDGNIWMSNTSATNDNLVLIAKFAGKSYKIRFNANGGSDAPSSMSVKYGQLVDLSEYSTPKLFMYKFLGWSDTPNGGVVSNDFTMLDEDMTFYAMYSVDMTIIILLCISGLVVISLITWLIVWLMKRSKKSEKRLLVVQNEAFEKGGESSTTKEEEPKPNAAKKINASAFEEYKKNCKKDK